VLLDDFAFEDVERSKLPGESTPQNMLAFSISSSSLTPLALYYRGRSEICSRPYAFSFSVQHTGRTGSHLNLEL
jgi:hypothetical protein